MKKIPNNFSYDLKENWNPKILKILNITSTPTFIVLRRILTRYIIENNLLKQNEIHLNNSLKDVFEYKFEKFKFNNLNNFIYNLVKV